MPGAESNSQRNRPTPKNPQSTDRGVLNTKHGVEALIDWFAFTIPTVNLSTIFDLLRIPEGNFVQMPKGGLGYKGKLSSGHINIYFDGRPEMGTHIQMTGQGCRDR